MEDVVSHKQAEKRLRGLIREALKEPPPVLSDFGDFYEPYYHLMYLFAGQIKDGLLIELGIHKGRGLVSLAAGSQQNLVIGLDTIRHPILEKTIGGISNVEFHVRPSLPIPLDILDGKQIDLLHIDTEHSYAMAQAEFEAYRPYLAQGAYVLFDDLHAMEDGVLKYFNELPYPKVQDDRLHPVCGYGVLIYDR